MPLPVISFDTVMFMLRDDEWKGREEAREERPRSQSEVREGRC